MDADVDVDVDAGNGTMLAQIAQTGDGLTVTLSTGVVMRAVPVLDEVIMRIHDRVKAPKVPRVMNTAKGRLEENKSDPDYLAAMERYQIELALASSNALLMYGAQLVSVPEGFPGPDDPEWLEDLELSKLGSGAGRMARFFDWLTLRAMRTRDDRKALMFAIGRATGTTEDDVQAAYKSAGD